jgi:hypothetical protein
MAVGRGSLLLRVPAPRKSLEPAAH